MYLVSRLATKSNGQPSLPVLLVAEFTGYRELLAKIAGYRENKWILNSKKKERKKMWFTLKQVFIVAGQGSAIIQMTCVHSPPYRRLVLGQESVKCEKLCQPHRTGPQQEQMDC